MVEFQSALRYEAFRHHLRLGFPYPPFYPPLFLFLVSAPRELLCRALTRITVIGGLNRMGHTFLNSFSRRFLITPHLLVTGSRSVSEFGYIAVLSGPDDSVIDRVDDITVRSSPSSVGPLTSASGVRSPNLSFVRYHETHPLCCPLPGSCSLRPTEDSVLVSETRIELGVVTGLQVATSLTEDLCLPLVMSSVLGTPNGGPRVRSMRHTVLASTSIKSISPRIEHKISI